MDYVISKNVKRRHLTTSQLAVLAGDLVTKFDKEDKKTNKSNGQNDMDKTSSAERNHHRPAIVQAARALGIGEAAVKRAERVAKEAPDLLPGIKSGKMSVTAAEQEVVARLAKKSVKRTTDRDDKKERKQNDREVKQYLDAVKMFGDAAQKAKKVAAYGKFSPEAKKYTTRQHDKLRVYMEEVEGAFNA